MGVERWRVALYRESTLRQRLSDEQARAENLRNELESVKAELNALKEADSSRTAADASQQKEGPATSQGKDNETGRREADEGQPATEGEVEGLRRRLRELERAREELASEVVEARKDKDLKERYKTAVELLGEKDEEVEQLQADLDDLRRCAPFFSSPLN